VPHDDPESNYGGAVQAVLGWGRADSAHHVTQRTVDPGFLSLMAPWRILLPTSSTHFEPSSLELNGTI